MLSRVPCATPVGLSCLYTLYIAVCVDPKLLIRPAPHASPLVTISLFSKSKVRVCFLNKFISMNNFVVHPRLTQHCKPTMPQYKIKFKFNFKQSFLDYTVVVVGHPL